MATAIEFAILAKDHASKVFRDVGKESEKSSTKMEKFHKVGAAAGVALAGGLALAGAAAVKMTKAAAVDQQGASRLAQTLHKATGATKEQQHAVEDWITAQGKAFGVADDDLRPALSKLAVATGSVTKAQKLAKLAMDVSAGSGKSLSSVAFALAKAQNGNVSGLARLGVQTTKTTGDTMALQKAQTSAKSAQLSYAAAVKAHGKNSAEAAIASDKLKQANEAVTAAQTKTKKTTLSLDQITKNLGNTYGGAASKNAQTAAGKQKILAVQMQELQEQIGYALIPVMGKLVGVGLKVVNWISHNTTTAGILVGVIGGLVAITWAVSAATKAWFAITKLITAAQIVFTNAQWALNVAMEANPIGLVVIAIAALVVGMVIAYKKSATFRAIVQGAFHGILAASKAVASFFTSKIPAAFHAVMSAAGKTIGWVKSNWPLLLAILTGPIGLAVLAISKNWDKIKSGAQNALHAVTGFFSSLPGKIKSALGNLGSLLFGAGKAVVQGLIDGIGSMVGALTSKLHSITKLIPIHKGPIEKDRVLLKPAGVAIMEGLIAGIESKRVAVQTVLDKVTAAVQAAGQKLKAALSARNSFASGFQSFSSSAFGADYGTDDAGNAIAPTAASVLAYQQQQAAQAHMVKRDVRKLVKMGLSPALIKQLQAAGAAGIPTIEALANGSQAQIRQYNALNKQTSADLQSAGMTAGNRLYGQQIKADRQHYAEEQKVLREIRDLLKATNGKAATFTIHGNDLVAILKKVDRTTGRKP